MNIVTHPGSSNGAMRIRKVALMSLPDLWSAGHHQRPLPARQKNGPSERRAAIVVGYREVITDGEESTR